MDDGLPAIDDPDEKVAAEGPSLREATWA